MSMLSRLTCALALASVTITPVATLANTRAGDSDAIYSVATPAGPGLSGTVDGEKLDEENNFLVALLLGSWITGIAFIIFEDDNQSPGGN